ncbi:MAG: hypothetical protein RR356_06425, partial [Bacteroidales bacterium]
MLPVWIINLSQNAIKKEYLNQLIYSLSKGKKSSWHYLEFKPEEAIEVVDAKSCSTLLNKIIAEGRICIETYQQKGWQISHFKIAILGDATDSFSRSCFHLMPDFIRSVIQLILPEYVNNGIDITG